MDEINPFWSHSYCQTLWGPKCTLVFMERSRLSYLLAAMSIALRADWCYWWPQGMACDGVL